VRGNLNQEGKKEGKKEPKGGGANTTAVKEVFKSKMKEKGQHPQS